MKKWNRPFSDHPAWRQRQKRINGSHCRRKAGDRAMAEEKLQEAARELTEAHHYQTELIQNEAGGEKTDMTLLMVHAQDHLMNAMTVKDLAAELVEIYEKVSLQGGAKI